MAERDGAAVDVEAIRIERDLLEAREHLGGERFVELHEIDLVERQARELERLANRRHRTDAEPLRLDAGRRERDEPPKRGETAFPRAFGRRDDDGGGPVACLRRVARGHRAAGMERRS